MGHDASAVSLILYTLGTMYKIENWILLARGVIFIREQGITVHKAI